MKYNYQHASFILSPFPDLCPQCVPFYGNRSAVYLMLGQPRQALEDAKTAVSLDPEFSKGWTRSVGFIYIHLDVILHS